MIGTECTPSIVEPLPGTVKLYHRHLFVCTHSDQWTARIEEVGGFLQAATELINRRLPEMSHQVKLTACAGLHAENKGSTAGYDLLVFPDMIRYLNVQESDLQTLGEDHLIGNQIAETIPHQPLSGQHIFVCTHGQRDMRCGQCGPPLLEAFETAIAGRNLVDKVTIWKTSHVGGHRFAGNILIYPSGDWYGYVTPADVPQLVKQHLIGGETVPRLWRGRMGLSPQEQIEQMAL